jgi:hypothetical protein
VDGFSQPSHLALGQAERLFFERRLINPLDEEGRPTAPGYGAADKPSRYLFANSRIVHAYAIAYLIGRPGTDIIVDRGLSFFGIATASPTTADSIAESAMAGHRIQPSTGTVTPSSYWRRRVPRLQRTRVPIDFSLISQRSYGSGSGKCNMGLSRRNSLVSGSPLIAFEAKTRHASDRIVDGGVRCSKRFNVSPIAERIAKPDDQRHATCTFSQHYIFTYCTVE